jgi:hypothetical protein
MKETIYSLQMKSMEIETIQDLPIILMQEEIHVEEEEEVEVEDHTNSLSKICTSSSWNNLFNRILVTILTSEIWSIKEEEEGEEGAEVETNLKLDTFKSLSITKTTTNKWKTEDRNLAVTTQINQFKKVSKNRTRNL